MVIRAGMDDSLNVWNRDQKSNHGYEGPAWIRCRITCKSVNFRLNTS